jgi:hypothetical protein
MSLRIKNTLGAVLLWNIYFFMPRKFLLFFSL